MTGQAGPLYLPVEASLVMLFRRALGDLSVDYERACNEPVPLTFTQVTAHFDPDYELRPRAGQEWFGSGAGPGRPRGDGSSTRLHAEQHFEYHRPLRVGEVLQVVRSDGRRWSKKGSAGRTLEFSERITTFLDPDNEPVVVVRSVSVEVLEPTEVAEG